MNKQKLAVLLGLVAAAALTGCSSNKETADTELSSSAPETDSAEELSFEKFETETETEEPIEPITPSSYLIANDSEYATLTGYEGLAVTQYTYEVTDDMVQEQLDNTLEMFGEEEEVDRACTDGDIIYFDLSYEDADGNSVSESTYLSLGAAEYGDDFDQEMTGLAAQDTKTFSVAFDSTAAVEDWMDRTVEFSVTMQSVCELHVPEYTDEFVQEYTDFSTKEEFEAYLRSSLEEEYQDLSYSETVDALITAALEQTVFTGYPQELYDTCQEEVISGYEAFADSLGSDDIYELFGITEEEVDEEILNLVNRRLLISAIAHKENLTVTEDEYLTHLRESAAYFGYSGAAEYERDYTRPALVWSLYEEKVGAALYETAQITEELYVEEEADIEDAEMISETEETAAADLQTELTETTDAQEAETTAATDTEETEVQS